MKQKQTLIVTLAIVIVLLLVFGTKMFYIIRPGERAVVFRTISGFLDKENIVGTGLKLVAPWNSLYKYDVKEQKSEETMDVLDKNGLSINVDVTVRFNPRYDKIGDLHEIFGTNYVSRLVIPEVRSTVRQVTGRYTAEEIYSTRRSEVEAAIITETATILEKNNIEMKALLIRSIGLPTDIITAIESKLTREQEALAMKFINERERLEADRKSIEASGIANFNRIISASLTDKILQQKGIDATLVLAQSPNSKVVVIGSTKDGLPLILGNN
ncbi:MAG: prohibitin family protein [Marinilabiliaceae bacterium]|jgi:regulator of protease activity HflC (stomatin/prohibitin superfamily)|nr:prohibitin family protein [Marinilabiliaceae bacterium]